MSIATLEPALEMPLEQNAKYKQLFDKLDVLKLGKISFEDFEQALARLNHPIHDDPAMVKTVFQAFDCNNDKVIDFSDLENYLQTTDEQIRAGFMKIDRDQDGKLNRDDFTNYLRNTLALEPTPEEVNFVFEQIDTANQGYITYDEFRDFLLLMPRLDGSRVKTAFTFMAEELDLSLDGEVTLINHFLNGFGYFLAGGLAGVVLRTATAPFDRIKVFLIARTDLLSTVLHSKLEIENTAAKLTLMLKEARKRLSQSQGLNISLVQEHPHKKTIRSPMIQAARTIWKQSGFRGFYVGNGLNVFKVFPELAMKFGLFEATKRVFARALGLEDTLQLSKFYTYLAGGIGGVCGQFTVYPIDTLKFRIQCSKLDSRILGHKLLIKTASDMYKEGGIRIFYRGILAGVSGIFPYAALDLGTFTTTKRWLIARQARKEGITAEEVKLPNYMVLSLGAALGSFGATVVYPINLLRTRLQAQGTYAHPYTYDGFFDVLRKTLAREGVPGLYKGLVPNLAKVAPAVLISYFMYENLTKLFGLKTTN